MSAQPAPTVDQFAADATTPAVESFGVRASKLVADALRDPARLLALRKTGLLDSPGRDAAFNRVVRLAARVLRVPVAQVNLVTDEAQVPIAWHAPEPERWASPVSLGYSYCQHVVTLDRPLAVSDARVDPLVRDSRATRESGIVSYLAVPLRAPGGEVLGSVCVVDAEVRQWSAEQVAALEDVAALAADEVVLRTHAWLAERAAREAAERGAERAERLQHVTAALTGARGRREVAELAVVEGARAVGALSGAVGLLAEAGAWFELVASHGLSEERAAGWRRQPNAGDLPLPTVVRTLAPLWISTPRELEALDPAAADLVAAGARACAALPLAVADAEGRRRAVGGLMFTFAEPRAFASGERAFLLALAEVAAQAIERATLDEAERAARERLLETLERMGEGFFAFDDEWRCEYVNAAGRAMMRTVGGDPTRVIGRNAWDAFPPLLGTPLHGAMLEAVRTGRPTSVEDCYRGVWVECQVVPSRGTVAVYLRDVTERRQAEAERAQLYAREQAARRDAEAARVAAESASKAKSDFLAVMSHELRTPLNAIGGYAELLEMGVRGPVTPQQAEDLQRIQRSQRHLLGLINQVLSYARVEAGALEYHLEEIAVSEALGHSDALVAPQLAAKGLSFHYQGCDPDVRVRADGEKVQQIVLNLLSNAVKFTDRGGSVTLSCEARDDVVLVRVRDSGRGIAAEKLASIFEPFVQADPSHTRTHQGVGLGLSISRTLAVAMRGTLDVESSEVGGGTTFLLTLPRARAGQ